MKSTKKSLALSALSLLLCISMLMGTTFAWFTDSVTSGVNQIIAGNLDVDAEYSTDGENWVSLQGSTSLFSSALWEPGHTEVVYLRVVNKGTLALNYRVNVTPIEETGGVNQAGESFRLSDYMCFKTNEPKTDGTVETYADRPAARAIFTTEEIERAVNGKSTMLSLVQTDVARTGVLYPETDTEHPDKDEAAMALVVYMPEGVGNDANYMTGTQAPEIKLGVTVYAWQEDYEEDSFNKDYDLLDEFDALTPDEPDIGVVEYDYFPQVSQIGNVKYDENGAVKAEGASDEKGVVTITSTELVDDQPAAKLRMKVKATDDANASGNVKLNVYKDDTGNGTFQAKSSENSIDLTEKDTTTYEVNVTTEGVTVADDNAYIVDMPIGKNLKNVEMWHNTNNSGVLTKMTENTESRDALVDAAEDDTFYYDSATGVVTLYAMELCPFSAVYDKAVAAIGSTRYYTLEEAATAAKAGDTVVLIKDVDLTDRTGFYELNFAEDVTLDLQGHTVTSKNGGVVYQGEGLTICDGKFVAAEGGSYALFIGNGTKDTTVTLNGLTCVGGIKVYYATVTIEDTSAVGVAGTNYYAVWGDVGAHINIESGVFTSKGAAVVANEGYVDSDSEDYSWIQIFGGTFTAPDSGNVFLPGDSWIILYGGTYNQNPEELTGNEDVYCPFGYSAKDNSNGTWTVQPADIGTTYFNGGEGTSEEPYKLNDASQLVNISRVYNLDYANGSTATEYYELDANLDLASVEGSSWYYCYGGSIDFDLNGHTISNVAKSLFACVDAINIYDGEINFKDEGEIVDYLNDNPGDVTFSNLTLSGTINISQAHYGPLLSYAYGLYSGSCTITAKNIKNNIVNIYNGYSGGYTGGLFGYIQGSAVGVSITDCEICGYIQGSHVGGFLNGCCYPCAKPVVNSGNVLKAVLLGSDSVQAFGLNGNYNGKTTDTFNAAGHDALVDVTGATLNTVTASTTLLDAALGIGSEITIDNAENSGVSYYTVALEYWVNKNSDGTGGYPYQIIKTIDSLTVGKNSTGLYKYYIVQVDDAPTGEKSYVVNTDARKIWVENNTYYIYDTNYTMYSKTAYIRVAGYDENGVMKTYQYASYSSIAEE